MAGIQVGRVQEDGWKSGDGGGEGVTLIVKHLPDSLKGDMVKKLFAHYGAVDVRLCSASGRLRNCAFVDFKDGGEASRAQLALHRLKLVDKVLAVEKATPPKRKDSLDQQQQHLKQEDGLLPPSDENTRPVTISPAIAPPIAPLPNLCSTLIRSPLSSVPIEAISASVPAPASSQAFPPLVGTPSGLAQVTRQQPLLPGLPVLPENKPTRQQSLFKGDPIAPSLGIDFSPDPKLEYAYPPPDMNILTNIVNSLVAVPKFYTQVLHLMNKMNLPPPFRPAMPPPPLPPAQASPKKRPLIAQPTTSSSSSESELGSDSDSEEEDGGGDGDGAAKEGGREGGGLELTEEMKKQRRKERHRAKRAKAALSDPKVVSLLPKPVVRKPGIRVNKPILEIKLQAKGPAAVAEKMAAQEAMAKQKAEEEEAAMKTAIKKELRAGKVPSEEILANPMFKKYQPGVKTQVLYIKNLSKDVVTDDLRRIYGAFIHTGEDLIIKLMQEGRMKGQAFVTLPTEDAAEEALKETHGYMLKEKPMIVQFGKNQSGGASSGPPTGAATGGGGGGHTAHQQWVSISGFPTNVG